ncbi:hypothetical protein GGF32_006952, partial [Allomyces javanicus]
TVINPNSTKFSGGALSKQGSNEFHPNKNKKLKLGNYSGVHSIDLGHNSFLTIFEATAAQFRAILANKVLPKYIQDKIQTWDQKSDSQSILTKRLMQFWARDLILKDYMDGKPMLKMHQMHKIFATTR